MRKSQNSTLVLVCGVLAACVALAWGRASTGGGVTAPAAVTSAYAHVLGDGTLDKATSLNVIKMGGASGLYCFQLPFTPKTAVATISDDPTAPDQGLAFIQAAVPPTPTFTCSDIPNPSGVVAVYKENSVGNGSSTGGHAFYVYFAK